MVLWLLNLDTQDPIESFNDENHPIANPPSKHLDLNHSITNKQKQTRIAKPHQQNASTMQQLQMQNVAQV